MKSERTKNCKKLGILFTALSWALCFGICITFVIIALARPQKEQTELQKQAISLAITVGVSLIPMIVLAFIAKDKIRPTVWMANIIMANVLFSSTVMYIIFFVWIIDEYIITALGKSYRSKYVINKEIDRRG